ncbi:hypothetical protein jhhlp_000097 [Lomentospora prolificans]|uniref:PPM-type phosphatase domain-containing protein n=1 Tax=Lomentospora prolificans TaxID=41688 RepID=A0A2N3NLI9_9PEZI|nr:hypothetical protein jhhlp_000097 [Lomentospora prolificans]
MFGGGSSSSVGKSDTDSPKSESKQPSPEPTANSTSSTVASTPPAAASSITNPIDQAANSGEKRSGNGGLPTRQDIGGSSDKKRRSSGVSGKASSLLASAKNSLNFSQGGRGSNPEASSQSSGSKLGKDAASSASANAHNNSAGESLPGPKSTFQVGVWEDRNRKCRRTMEDTHAFLYNFLTPALGKGKADLADTDDDSVETDNGYFAIFDGHAGTFAADWCGKKLHLILEEVVRKNPTVPMPELLDQTFTAVDSQLEKLPLKNSGCTAAIAVLRWEDRPQQPPSASLASKRLSAVPPPSDAPKAEDSSNFKPDGNAIVETNIGKAKGVPLRSRVLYTANVGDARIILCRAGKALRLSYDHKGSDENEGRRISNAGGLILNNRVNGVLAVTRALGDAYIKDLVTGHPYTTETVIQPDADEFIIIACDGLWDVCSDQEAVDLVREIEDPNEAAKLLVDHALNRFSTDNLSCMIVRFKKEQQEDQDSKNKAPVSGDSEETDVTAPDKTNDASEDATPTASFKPTALESTAEEEPSAVAEAEGKAKPTA